MMQGLDVTQIPHTLMAVESRHAVWIAGPGCVRHEVFGEEYNQQHMHRIAAATHGRSDVPVAAWLEPESGNVVIWAMGSKVGFLPAQIAAAWHPVLCNFKARYNVPIACQGTLDMPSVANNGVMGMVVWLPPLRPNVPQVASSSGYPPVAAIVAPQRDEAAALRAELAKTKQDLDAALEKAKLTFDELFLARDVIRTIGPELDARKDEVKTLRADLDAALEKARNAVLPAEELAKTRTELQKLGTEVEARQKELRSVEEALDIQAFGFYKPKYGFESSTQYTARLKGIRDEQQSMIKDNSAAPCDTTWTVGGSVSEGKKMVKQQAKLMLRAFNGECDAAIAKVRYDNAVIMQSRIEKAYADINKLGEVQRVFIAQRYLELKLAELHLVHEHREKVEEEKQEQKRIREQMREEQKALAEIERAKTEAEKEEAAKAAALEKAKAELAADEATSKQHEKLEALVARLENELKSALDQKAKAIARAQLTRSGHVYVLSNVGSFGENIYKIGLTRRLDPFDRVEELGDASVPFPFDVHAIIFAEDAPALETKLHKAFADRRVNLVNMRKEYFKVTLEEIQEEVKKHHGFVSFTLTAEAEEFRKSISARQAGVIPEFVEPPPLEM
ncbi:MAG TPA: DUF4041 domain-containing protein, partial [Polyangium sp.]|nr:DUF4041 domain-containing protein [Polyangium sp.]